MSPDRTVQASLVTLFDSYQETGRVSSGLAEKLDALRRYLVNPHLEFQPFLSVIMRTQGKRLEPLKDALLCLYSQTDSDFEVIIVDHGSSAFAARQVAEIIGSYPQSFRDKIRVIRVEGGTRGTPLNVGVQAAHGRFVAVYDDDDLIFAHWVESFHSAERAGVTRLMRANVAVQQAVPELWPQDQSGFRTLSWPKADYAKSFNQVDHLIMNHSPFMSWAFPRSLFTEWGLVFDETLSVCEDWDMILRGSTLMGVDDVLHLTAIYRKWEGASSSYTEHDRASWLASEARVIEKLNENPWVASPGVVEDIRKYIAAESALHPVINTMQVTINTMRDEYSDVVSSRSWKITQPLRWLYPKLAGIKRRIRRLLRQR
ncbi:glycosyltransferase family 2 protein [Lysinibacter sp. HNR]|uniref:glycosyltransferase family 2 protein n=1 Tax=Lysinibacter sp. HNR TaxID=3031408 RepID=UPI002435D037|nr:glycosyltransferase family 2 protein [Lysinibacter sp. HNR]WGD38070.1 glycosyltransferase family 2 protein [Lysinibacter sp. HNR]